MSSKTASILIVDPSPDNREVLQVALQRRGFDTWAVSPTEDALSAAEQVSPDVMVVDVEDLAAEGGHGRDAFVLSARIHSGSLVLVGNEHPRVRRADEPTDVRVSKPYQFASLVNKIEEVLAGNRGTVSGFAPRALQSSAECLKRAA